MMKHSLVAVFSVLTCIVYGQYPGHWHQNLHGFRPYVAVPPSSQNNLANLPIATQHFIDEQSHTRHVPVIGTIALVDLIVQNYIRELKTKLSETNAELRALSNKVDAFKCTCLADDPKTIDKIPGSCADLQTVGNTRSGLYSIMGSNQVETVYCDFTKDPSDPSSQTLIGYQDVKSKPVYFYVLKGQNFATLRVPIPYDNAIVNIGNGMTMATGKFKAPVKGTYFFSFTSHVEFAPNTVNPKTRVYIYRNGGAVAISALYEVTTIPATPSYLSPITLQCTLELLPDDTVWMQMDEMTNGKLMGTDLATAFTGWLLQEDFTTSRSVGRNVSSLG